MKKGAVRVSLFVRAHAGCVHRRLQTRQGAKPDACADNKDAAIPPVIAGGDVLARQFGGGFLDELPDLPRACCEWRAQPDVAEAGVDTRGANAQRNDRALLRMVRPA